jgi:16S rRNA (guanine527-N7)-methyltransferase
VTRKGSAGDPLDELLSAIPVLAGRPATADDRRRFARYLELILEWNRVHDLTGLKDSRAIVRGLFVDSLLFLSQLPSRPVSLLDIGSGVGVPGLPLHLVDPGITVTLMEARQKRVSFLATVRRELRLDGVRVVEARAENAIGSDTELAGRFDAVVARAITPTPQFLATCRRYLRPGGRVVVSGPPAATPLPPSPSGSNWVRAPYPKLGIERVFLTSIQEA